jgi:predicted alpha-1,2-mannosidase
MMLKRLVGSLAGIALGGASLLHAETDLVKYVNVLQGTESVFEMSNGNTVPMLARPYAMTDWSIQTTEKAGWWFDPKSKSIQGFRSTHQPSPWMGDYGNLNIMAAAGSPTDRAMGDDVASQTRQSDFDPASRKLSPDKFALKLVPCNVGIEATATSRSAIYRFTFPAGKTGRVMLEALANSGIELSADKKMFTGYTRSNNGGVPENFAMYFAAVFDTPIEKAQISKLGNVQKDIQKLDGPNTGAVLDFASSDKEQVVTMRIGTSFISAEQAALNAKRELGDKDFDTLQVESHAVWNKNLGRIEITAEEKQMRTFYSCYYRAQLFPREFYEYDTDEKAVHYSPFNGGKVVPGILYTDNGFWDTYRTFYSLIAITDPERLSEILQGWLQVYIDGGWFAQWPSPGYRACMIGSHSDIVFADAAVKKIPGVDFKKVLEGMLKHANTPVHGDEGFGRPGLDSYLKHGYVAMGEAHASASATLDYAYDDFAIAQVARSVGDEKTAKEFEKRAMAYTNVFDTKIGFVRGKDGEGHFAKDFDPYFWGGAYVEGGPWQSTWSVQHDPAGLIKLMGGAPKFVRKLDQMWVEPGTYHTGKGGYEGVIHEMREMARLPFGQYAHSNQTVHHVPYLYVAAGYPWKTQYWVRQIMDVAYGPDAFCGDEDNGEMSAWYILSALGIYPLAPGRVEYVLGSPLYTQAKVNLPGGKTFTINAPNNSPENVFVKSVTLNGKPYDKLWVSYFDIMAGATLDFTMSPTPVVPTTPWKADQLPSSLSGAPADLTIDQSLKTAK